MSYPTAPSALKIAWDNELSFQSSAVPQRFDGGVDFRTTRGQLNQMLSSLSITANLNFQEYLTIEQFLSANIGKPFYFNNVLYICDEYSWSILYYEPLTNDGLFKLDSSLKEVVRPV